MADRIVFNYPEMETVASKIDGYAAEYEQAASAFLTAMQNATASWEGASKDKFETLVSNSIYKHMHESVPQMVRGLAEVLKSNANAMRETDADIAAQIPDGI